MKRKDAWQQLGTTLNTTSAQEALEDAGLTEWNVRKEDLQTVGGVAVPDRFAVVRDDPFLGTPEALDVVGSIYQVHQNEDWIEHLNQLPGDRFSAAGEVDGGRRVFVTKEILPEEGPRSLEMHCALVWSHDGSMSPSILLTPIWRPTGTLLNVSLPFKVSQLEALTSRSPQTFYDISEDLANTPMTQNEFDQAITKYGAPAKASEATRTRAQTKLDKMSSLFTGETAWDGLLALCEWFDHHSPVRGTDRARKAIFDQTFKSGALDLMTGGLL